MSFFFSFFLLPLSEQLSNIKSATDHIPVAAFETRVISFFVSFFLKKSINTVMNLKQELENYTQGEGVATANKVNLGQNLCRTLLTNLSYCERAGRLFMEKYYKYYCYLYH